jgi:hypothetical protein
MRSRWLVVSAVAAAAVAAFACKSKPTAPDPCGTGTPPSLVGSYTFQSYKVGTHTYAQPGSFGSLRFTDATYIQIYTLPIGLGGVDSTISDTGSYFITGERCISQFSAVDTTHFSGTFTLVTTSVQTTYTATGSNGTEPVTWIWAKVN